MSLQMSKDWKLEKERKQAKLKALRELKEQKKAFRLNVMMSLNRYELNRLYIIGCNF